MVVWEQGKGLRQSQDLYRDIVWPASFFGRFHERLRNLFNILSPGQVENLVVAQQAPHSISAKNQDVSRLE